MDLQTGNKTDVNRRRNGLVQVGDKHVLPNLPPFSVKPAYNWVQVLGDLFHDVGLNIASTLDESSVDGFLPYGSYYRDVNGKVSRARDIESRSYVAATIEILDYFVN